MEILTLNVGQGSFTVLLGAREAFIVDARIPPLKGDVVAHLFEILARHLKDRPVRGLILTGFESDNVDGTGVRLLLKHYQPEWVMYPVFRKETRESRNVFAHINETGLTFKAFPIKLANNNFRHYHPGSSVSEAFKFEIFSPYASDLDLPINSGLVVKVASETLSYLITGDTDNARWHNINRHFGLALKSDVLAAPHHGSDDGINRHTLLLVQPHTVLISAGRDNPYGYPQEEALRQYRRISKAIHCTAEGHAFRTYRDQANEIVTEPVN